MTLDIVTRAEWGARPPRSTYSIDIPTPELWIHHSAGALDENGNGVWWDDLRSIQDFHMDGRGWSDIAYSFLVGGGQVFEGRGFGVAGGHTQDHNSISHAICLLGNYEFMVPTPEDLRAIADLARHGRTLGYWGEITGDHSQASGASTACAGRNLRDALPEIRRLAAVDTAPPPQITSTEEDDMLVTERKSDGSRIHDLGARAYYFAPKFVKGQRKRQADLVLDDAGWETYTKALGDRLVKVD